MHFWIYLRLQSKIKNLSNEKKNPPIHSRSPPTKMLVPRNKCFWTVYNYFRKSFKNHPTDQTTNDLPFKFRSDIDLCRREQNGSFVEGNSKKIKSKLLFIS